MSRPGELARHIRSRQRHTARWHDLSIASVAVAAVPPALILSALFACGLSSPAPAGRGAEIRGLTGARTRLVWVQGDGTDPFAAGSRLVLMGLDTDDQRGERVILAERRSYMKPLLSSPGDLVVFSTRTAPEAEPDVFVVNWDGSRLRRLAKGFALAVWQDPADRGDWVYVGLDRAGDNYRTVRRFRLDDPESSELVWNRTQVSADSFQLTADGRLAGGLFPWPDAGVAGLPNGALRRLGEGCWTGLNDVGTLLFWYFDGAHRNLTIVNVTAGSRWTVGINTAPGFAGAEAYHPRWANHPRFMAVTGPYNLGGENQVRSGGAQAEVWLGRFSSDYTRVEAWVRATHNDGGDAYPDVWVDRDRGEHPMQARSPVGPASAGSAVSGSTPSSSGADRLTVAARLVTPGVIPAPRAIAPYRQALVASVYEVVNVIGGTYRERSIVVAQWAIRDGRVLSSARRTAGTIYRLTLEPYETHPELEGERLVIGDNVPALRLFYEVGSP